MLLLGLLLFLLRLLLVDNLFQLTPLHKLSCDLVRLLRDYLRGRGDVGAVDGFQYGGSRNRVTELDVLFDHATSCFLIYQVCSSDGWVGCHSCWM